MQRNNLLFKYVHTAEEKNLPSFCRVGIKSEQRDWFMDVSYAAALWQKPGWKRIMKNSKRIMKNSKKQQISHEAEGNKRESLVCDSWKSVGGSRTRAWIPQTSAQVSVHAKPADKTPANLTAPWR